MNFMPMRTINGFIEPEIFKLYAFLEAYETAGIARFKTQTSMLKQHPELTPLLDDLEKIQYQCSNSEEMRRLDFKKFNNEIYMIESRTSYLLTLLYHLRNSIAHAAAVKHGDAVLITDFKRNRPTDFSARGRIDMSIIESFTKTLQKFEL